MKTTKIVLILCSFVFLFSACSVRNPVGAANLDGETWVLTNLNGNDPIDDHRPTIHFEAGKISGNASCNYYGSSYLIEAESISFDGLCNTEMACMDPEGVMEQEQIYLELLGAAQRFELVDGVLTIFTGSQQTLTFEMQQALITSTPAPEQPSPIPATTTVEIIEPTLQPTFAPPNGFKEYQDAGVGISIFIPESWVVTGVIDGYGLY